MILGAHESIAGGIYQACFRAREDGCEALQIFSKSANQWSAKPLTDEDIQLYKVAREEVGIAQENVMIHDSYLINFGNPDEKKWAKAVHFFTEEVKRGEALGIQLLVFHPGAHVGGGEKKGITQIVEAMNKVIDDTEGFKVRMLLETTAGQGTYLGYTFEQLAEMLDGVTDKDRAGVCYDTCHTFAAGYDIRTKAAYEETFERLDETLGIGKIFAFHLNDSLKELGSRVDRHEQIGDGMIGPEGFANLMNDARFESVPGILETPPLPNGEDSYTRNLKVLRSLIKE